MGDLIAALVGLLTAQVFLVGFVAVRLDAVYDDARARIRATAARLTSDPTVTVQQVRAEAYDCREQVMVVSPSLTSVMTWLVAAFGALLSFIGARILLGGNAKHPWRWLEDLTLDASRWSADGSSLLALLVAIVLLAALAANRARLSRARLRAVYEDTGLQAVLNAFDAVSDLADGPRGPHLVDLARLMLGELEELFPTWFWTSGLRGDFWCSVALDAASQDLCRVTSSEALRRAMGDYDLALKVNDGEPQMLVRDAVAAYQLARKRSTRDNERWELLLHAAARCQRALAADGPKVDAALLLVAVAKRLGDCPNYWRLPGTMFASQRARRLRSWASVALNLAMSSDAVESRVLFAWAKQMRENSRHMTRSRRVHLLVIVLRRLEQYLVDGAGRIRAATSNIEVLDIVSELTEGIKIAIECLGAVPATTAETVSTCFPKLLTPKGVPVSDLPGIAKAKDLTDPEVVIARSLIAYQTLRDARAPIRALWSLVRLPVRMPTKDGRMMRLNRVISGISRVVEAKFFPELLE